MAREDWQDLAPSRAVTGIPRLPSGPKHLSAVPVADTPDDDETHSDEDLDRVVDTTAEMAGEVGEGDATPAAMATTGTTQAGGPSPLDALRIRRATAVGWPKQFSTLSSALVSRLDDAELALFDATGRKISRSRITLAAIERLFAVGGDPIEAALGWAGRDDDTPARDHSFRLPPELHTRLRRASLELIRRDQQRTVSHLVGVALERFLDDLASELGSERADDSHRNPSPVGGRHEAVPSTDS